MPQIPTYEQRTRASSAGPGAGPTGAGRGLVALGQSLTTVAEHAAQRKEEDAALWAMQALSETQTEWTRQLIERQNSAEDGAPDFTPTLLKDFDDYVGKIVPKAPTRSARDYLQQRLAAYRSSLAGHAMVYEATERNRYTENVVGKAIDAARTEVFQAPELFAERLAERLTLIEQLRLPPERKRQLADDAQRLIAREAVAGMVETDTAGAMQLLRAPAGTSGVLAVEALTADDRARLMEAAERKRLAEVAAAERAAAAELKLAQDETSKDGDRLLAEGQLSARWIEENRDRLSAEDYRYFYRELTDPSGGAGGSAPRNVSLYADLRARASAGEDVRDDARSALTSGAIRVADYNNLLAEVESSRSGWYRRGVDFISTSAAVSDLNPDPAAAQRKAAMLDDWQLWASENPQATDTEAREAYQRIVREYAIIDAQKFTQLTGRLPRFMVGTRSAPDIDATEVRTVEAFENGEIDEAEFMRQAALIAEWRDTLQRRGDGGD